MSQTRNFICTIFAEFWIDIWSITFFSKKDIYADNVEITSILRMPYGFLYEALSEGHEALLATIVSYNTSTSLGDFNVI